MRTSHLTLALALAAPAALADTENPAVGDEALKLRLQQGKDESIYVVQRRAYSKHGDFEITPAFFTAVNPKFVGYWGPALAIGYHLRENLAVEFLTSLYVSAFYSDLVFEVYEYETLTPEEVDLKQIRYFNSLSLQFSALYGKLDFYGYLVDYDFYVSGGLGYAMTKEPCTPRVDGCSEEVDVGRGLRTPTDSSDAHKMSGSVGGGARFFFHDNIGMRAEVRDVVFADRKVETNQAGQIGLATTDIRNTILLFLGLSLTF